MDSMTRPLLLILLAGTLLPPLAAPAQVDETPEAVDSQRAIADMLVALEQDPNDWQARARLVQEYHALGRMEERDAARDSLLALRERGGVESLAEADFYCREVFAAAGYRVVGLEYFDLDGDTPLRYAWLVLDGASDEQRFMVTLGSSDHVNTVARERGEIAEGERLFHLDGYFDGDEHRAYAFFDGDPGYDVVRPTVVGIIRDEARSSAR